MGNLTIPPKDRIEWKQIVTGALKHNYQNYVLQMKVHQACKDVASQKVTVNEAIDSLYGISLKYALAVQTDFTTIFKTW
jgi:hypothetical protein